MSEYHIDIIASSLDGYGENSRAITIRSRLSLETLLDSLEKMIVHRFEEV